MKQKSSYGIERQRGIALPIIMVILLLAALVTLYTSNTSITEQKVTADQYRSEQAFATAQAGVDHALKTHNDYSPQFDLAGNLLSSGADVNSDANFSKGSYTAMFCDIWDDAGDKDKSADLMKDFLEDKLICTNLIDLDHPQNTIPTDTNGFRNDNRVGILSVGKPDDDSGRRTISLISAPARAIPKGGGPLQPLVAKSFASKNGTVQVINRYANATVWAGNSMKAQGNVNTFINNDILLDPATAIRSQLINPDEDINTIKASGQKIGANSDVIDNDHNLVNLSDNEMFEGFFAANRSDIYDRAEVYTNINDIPDGHSGLIWVDDPGLKSKTIGNLGNCNADPPAAVILIAEADKYGEALKIGSNSFICGIVFVFGDVTSAGTPTISGALILTGAYVGHGTVTVVFDPEALTDPPEGFKGSRGVDAGTWKDWGWLQPVP